ncbi:FAD-binding oxidoreductase [Candidatus Kaiserbacteria bacterium]|nr:FAD-binding oxidoreductase [Candidatus Kaiserbacteria bacterium]
MDLREDLKLLIKGDVQNDVETIHTYSRDTSIFERTPKVVVFPKDADDVSAIVKYVREAKERGEDISIAGRSAGTDMTGGPLTDSISMVFTKYMNHIGTIDTDTAVTEPGVYYRDFEKATLSTVGKILPSYPASRGLCAMGGIVSNNSGGELTLRYGKTNQYVRELAVVLSDGSQTTFKPLSIDEAKEKARQQDLEGAIYRDLSRLLEENTDIIEAARPTVTKNSAGYALWDVIDRDKGTFDLTQLITGSQGTLAMVTQAKIGLVKTKEHRAMLVIFLSDLEIIPEIVRRVLVHQPESFESYDKHTFRLAVRFFPQFLKQMGLVQMLTLGISFIPEMWMTLTGGIPELVLMVEFAEDSPEEALEKVRQARLELVGLAVKTAIARNEASAEKYWKIRRESFALLRKNVKGIYAAPFIDDFVVHPNDYPTFLPELNALLAQYHFVYTIAGHIGDGNFHIIPLLDMADPKSRQAILDLSPKVYELIAKYHGSITGEHNDGIIRTPYLGMMYGQKVTDLFTQVKHIFDPLNIFNPGKKVGGTLADIERSMIHHL